MLTERMYESKTFDEFWGYYQDIHASRSTRLAHAAGTASALLLLAGAVAKRSVKLAIAAPLIDYAIAQTSHRTEGITTKPYRKPLWHVRAELRLFRSTLRSLRQGRGGRREPDNRDASEPPGEQVPLGGPDVIDVTEPV